MARSGVCRKKQVIINVEGSRIALTHGDCLKPSWSYKLYYFFIRLQLIKFITFFLPGRLLDSICLGISNYSRNRKGNKNCPKSIVSHYANKWLETLNCDHGIFGHFHIALNEKERTTMVELFVFHLGINLQLWFLTGKLLFLKLFRTMSY